MSRVAGVGNLSACISGMKGGGMGGVRNINGTALHCGATARPTRRSFVTGALGCCLAAFAADALAGRDGTAHAAADAADPEPVRVAALKGPTAMGMVRLMDQVDTGAIPGAPYAFDIVATPDVLAPLIAKAEVDIAACPANLASVLYHNTDGGVMALAINVLGVLYICETGADIASVADLAGRTLYTSGKGATPQYALEYVLRCNGLDPARDLVVEWKSEHAECVAALARDAAAVALLPQPFVTVAQAENPAIRPALDLAAEWEAAQAHAAADGEMPSALVTGVLIARTAFAREHPDAVAAFLRRYRESVAYVNGHVDEAAELVGAYGIVPADIAAKALPACGIAYIDGAEMRAKLGGYLAVLERQNPKAVGGALPGDAFYYQAE